MKQFDLIQDYYGRVLETKNDLKTTACCSTESIPTYLKEIVSKIHTEVSSKFYGCGVPIPAAISGTNIVDLGSGTGRDCFVLSALTGDQGSVIGVDMTDEQLEVARRHQDYHAQVFNLSKSNIEFKKGYIEDLKSLDVADNSIDLVVSNCVINLSPDKHRVFSEIFRYLKPGGELYFSDVFCDRRLPTEFMEDSVLLGECLGGALYTEDFRRVMQQVGFSDFRTIASTPIEITNQSVKEKTGNAKFYSITFRAFKLELEDRCEDFGQVATYKGTIENFEHAFRLDDHHLFEAGRPMLVCSNTADMLTKTRFANHFTVQGDKAHHFGLFDCDPQNAAQTTTNAASCC